jgi:hypothetical protein
MNFRIVFDAPEFNGIAQGLARPVHHNRSLLPGNSGSIM